MHAPFASGDIAFGGASTNYLAPTINQEIDTNGGQIIATHTSSEEDGNSIIPHQSTKLNKQRQNHDGHEHDGHEDNIDLSLHAPHSSDHLRTFEPGSIQSSNQAASTHRFNIHGFHIRRTQANT